MADEKDKAAPAGGLPYGRLRLRHPSYDAEYWARLTAFYEGGKTLLDNPGLLSDVFPRHRRETSEVYSERVKRAFFVPYAGEIVGYICASLFEQQIAMKLNGKDDGAPLPDFYRGFVRDVSPPGGVVEPLNDFLRKQVLCALVKGKAWTLVDLPDMRPDAFFSRADQEKAGALKAYAVKLEPEVVVDWEEDDNGELIWLLTQVEHRRRASIADDRKTRLLRWHLYTRTEWARFEMVLKEDQKPKDEDIAQQVAGGSHNFGRVPAARLCLPHGLWVMDRLESMVREHFNKRSALGWAEVQSLLPELYEFLAAESPGAGRQIGAAQENESRAKNQPRGQGYVQERGADDRAEFIGPPTDPFAAARESCKELRDEMHRVTYQMALTVDNSAAALTRSAESKGQDRASTAVVLMALGALARKHAEDIFNLIAAGRGDSALAGQWEATGMEKFEAINLGDVVTRAVEIESVRIPSPTFQRLHKKQLAKALLGDAATDDDVEKIAAELKSNITDEEFKNDLPEDDAGDAGDDDMLDPAKPNKPAGPKPKAPPKG